MRPDRYSREQEPERVGPLPVKVYDAEGKLVRTISTAALSKRPSPVPASHPPVFTPREAWPSVRPARGKGKARD